MSNLYSNNHDDNMPCDTCQDDIGRLIEALSDLDKKLTEDPVNAITAHLFLAIKYAESVEVDTLSFLEHLTWLMRGGLEACMELRVSDEEEAPTDEEPPMVN